MVEPRCTCSNYLLTTVGKRAYLVTSLAVLLPKPYHLGETGWLSVQNATEHKKQRSSVSLLGSKAGVEVCSGETPASRCPQSLPQGSENLKKEVHLLSYKNLPFWSCVAFASFLSQSWSQQQYGFWAWLVKAFHQDGGTASACSEADELASGTPWPNDASAVGFEGCGYLLHLTCPIL